MRVDSISLKQSIVSWTTDDVCCGVRRVTGKPRTKPKKNGNGLFFKPDTVGSLLEEAVRVRADKYAHSEIDCEDIGCDESGHFAVEQVMAGLPQLATEMVVDVMSSRTTIDRGLCTVCIWCVRVCGWVGV